MLHFIHKISNYLSNFELTLHVESYKQAFQYLLYEFGTCLLLSFRHDVTVTSTTVSKVVKAK